MRIAIEWIKSNVVTVIAIAVAVLSLVVVIWIPQIKGKGSFRTALEDRQKVANQLAGYMKKTVPLPATNPDDPPKNYNGVTINEDVLTKLEKLYNGTTAQYESVQQRAVAFNQQGHDLLVEDLFPTWSSVETPFNAKTAYVNAFSQMFLPYDAEAPDAPRLNAGMPPTVEELNIQLDQVERDFVADISGTQLTEEDQQALKDDMQRKLMDILKQRAEGIHIYADVVADPRLGQMDYPFDIDRWAFLDTPPQPHQLWEGQLELWVQQDIVRAIGIANSIDDVVANVTQVPVKRLVSLRVVPGYVGLHTEGAALTGIVAGNPQRTDDAYPPPVGGQRTNKPDQRQTDNFFVTPTGRVSNSLYDVRQAILEVDIDSQRIPELIDALGQVNLMTVVHMSIEDVDEYEALREGFLYGENDVVRAKLVVETIWLRAWTEPLMPKRVLSYVGIDEPEEDVTPGMNPGMMPGMGPGGMPMRGPMQF